MAVLVYVADQAGQKSFDARVFAEQVIVIQDEDEMFFDMFVDIVDQGGAEHVLVEVILGGAGHYCQRGLAELGKFKPERGNEMSQEMLQVLVKGIDGKPADRQLSVAGEIDQ